MVRITPIALTAALAGLSQAVGNSRIVNKCDYDVTAWVVGSGEPDGPYTVKSKGKAFSKKFFRDPKSGGIAIKITKEEDGLYTGDPQTIFSYTLDPDKVFYDLSQVFGDTFDGEKLLLKGKSADCPAIEMGGEDRLLAVAMTRDCAPNNDVTLTLCA